MLYDTYRLQRDLIDYIAADRGLEVDWDGFEAELDAQRERARASWKADGGGRDVEPVWAELADRHSDVEFVGYTEEVVPEARVVAIVRDGAAVERLAAGERGAVVLDRTPFYAEAGGQIGDTGTFESDTVRARVEDTK